MAKYFTTIETPMSPADAFEYMTDLRNFAEWDEGVRAVDQVTGDGPGAGTAYDVELDNTPIPMTLRYRTVIFDRPHEAVVRAANSWLTSVDTVTVEPSGEGAVVTYEADLTLNGPLGVFDRLLRPVFERIGDRATAGLVTALQGTQR